MIDTLARLARAPQERAARVRAVIHTLWRRELRQARYRLVVLVLILATITGLIAVTVAVRWVGSWLL